MISNNKMYQIVVKKRWCESPFYMLII
jgi:hypothetical protein